MLKFQIELNLEPTIIELTGYEQNVTFDFMGHEVIGRLPRSINAQVGKAISLSLNLSEISIFDKISILGRLSNSGL